MLKILVTGVLLGLAPSPRGYAQPTAGSPLNPNASEHFVELVHLGHEAGDWEGGRIYINDADRSLVRSRTANRLATVWIVPPSPFSSPDGPVTEFKQVFHVNCFTKTAEDDPQLYAYGKGGQLIWSEVRPAAPREPVTPVPGSIGQIALRFLCSQ